MSSGTLPREPFADEISGSVTLRDIPWDLYVGLRDIEANTAVRMFYDDRTLTLSPPSLWRLSDEQDVDGVVMDEVPWGLYCQLRTAQPGRTIRMAYLDGELMIMSPSRLHEGISYALGILIHHWLMARGLGFFGAGATTLRRDDLEVGLEPDQCFYIQRLDAIEPTRATADLAKEPPPDLAIEVDVTNFSDQKLAIYAKLGVSEVWIWQDGLRILHLEGAAYQVRTESAVLPGFPVASVSELLMGEALDQRQIVLKFLEMIRT